MRVVIMLFLLAGASCAPPCTEFVPVEGGFRCPRAAKANEPFALVPVDRAYNSLWVAVDRCTVSVDGNSVNVAMERAGCSEPVPRGADVSGACTVPALAPGRYVIAGHDVVLPADGAPTSSCPAP